jgi:hypothetical protein
MYNLNVQWLANFIPSLATAMVMILVGKFVIKDQITLPAFVVFLNTMNQLGPTLSAVFMDVFHINKVKTFNTKPKNFFKNEAPAHNSHPMI